MRLIQYRNKDGYLPTEHTKFYISDKPDEDENSDFCQYVAKYVLCPETNGLKHLHICEECPLFGGHVPYNGVQCGSPKQNEIPQCYNQTIDQIEENLWKKRKRRYLNGLSSKKHKKSHKRLNRR